MLGWYHREAKGWRWVMGGMSEGLCPTLLLPVFPLLYFLSARMWAPLLLHALPPWQDGSSETGPKQSLHLWRCFLRDLGHSDGKSNKTVLFLCTSFSTSLGQTSRGQGGFLSTAVPSARRTAAASHSVSTRQFSTYHSKTAYVSGFFSHLVSVKIAKYT